MYSLAECERGTATVQQEKGLSGDSRHWSGLGTHSSQTTSDGTIFTDVALTIYIDLVI